MRIFAAPKAGQPRIIIEIGADHAGHDDHLRIAPPKAQHAAFARRRGWLECAGGLDRFFSAPAFELQRAAVSLDACTAAIGGSTVRTLTDDQIVAEDEGQRRVRRIPRRLRRRPSRGAAGGARTANAARSKTFGVGSDMGSAGQTPILRLRGRPHQPVQWRWRLRVALLAAIFVISAVPLRAEISTPLRPAPAVAGLHASAEDRALRRLTLLRADLRLSHWRTHARLWGGL